MPEKQKGPTQYLRPSLVVRAPFMPTKKPEAEIIEYSPLPAALVKKLKEFAKKGNEPDPMVQQMQQLEVQKVMAEVQEKQAEAKREEANAVENMAQADKAKAEAMLAYARAQALPGGNTAVEQAQVRKSDADASLAYARAVAVPQELKIKASQGAA